MRVHIFFRAGLFLSARPFFESSRGPLDFSEAESELVAGILTEFSGSLFMIGVLAEYFALVISLEFSVELFLSSWILIMLLNLISLLSIPFSEQLTRPEIMLFNSVFVFFIICS